MQDHSGADTVPSDASVCVCVCVWLCVCVCVCVCVCMHASGLSLSSISVPPLSLPCTQVIFRFLFLSTHSNTAHIDSHVNLIPSERSVIKNVHTHVCYEPAKRRKKKTKSAKRRNVITLRPQPSSKQRRRRRRLITSLGLSRCSPFVGISFSLLI